MKDDNFAEQAIRTNKKPPIHGVALLLFSLVLLFTTAASAQTYSVIHSFTGNQDGANPYTGLTLEGSSNLFGTTFGGAAGFGTVFSLKASGSGWVLNTLHTFQNGADGAGPMGRLVIGSDGALYGSTSAGGGGACVTSNNYHGCGTIYKLMPPPHFSPSIMTSWNATVLYTFQGTDGSYPQGDVMFDDSGTLYGTAVNGGNGWGLIYSLTPSDGGWTQNILYNVMNNGDGQYPWGGVIFDGTGNLYGVMTTGGPNGWGAVYKLARSGSGWTESTVHGFTYLGNDGGGPQSGLIMDASGNMYGTTVHAPNAGGNAYELNASGGGWNYNFLSAFHGGINLGPYASLVMDASGNLYGTTFADGQYGFGSVFELTRSGGSWTYHSLHDFTGGSDGASPMSALIFDPNGNIYGTASAGGAHNAGVVFKIAR